MKSINDILIEKPFEQVPTNAKSKEDIDNEIDNIFKDFGLFDDLGLDFPENPKGENGLEKNDSIPDFEIPSIEDFVGSKKYCLCIF